MTKLQFRISPSNLIATVLLAGFGWLVAVGKFPATIFLFPISKALFFTIFSFLSLPVFFYAFFNKGKKENWMKPEGEKLIAVEKIAIYGFIILIFFGFFSAAARKNARQELRREQAIATAMATSPIVFISGNMYCFPNFNGWQNKVANWAAEKDFIVLSATLERGQITIFVIPAKNISQTVSDFKK